MKALDHLLKAVREAAVFNPEVQVAPACILWPDGDRQWESVIPLLQSHLPELLVLGDYAPERRKGPAIWLRCVIAGCLQDVTLPDGKPPIIYLPGVSRQDLRAIESCPDFLKPLAELQYRGVIWSQINAKDWTILAWLKSEQGGLGLDVAQDNDTRNAMQLALHHFLEEDVSLLKGKRLDRDYFNTLLSGGDPVRELLLWLNDADAFQKGRGANEWKAFVEVCKSQLAFNPQNEGVLNGAAHLAHHQGAWQAVWKRYREAPALYPDIPEQIRKCKAPDFDLLADEQTAGGWPQWNEAQEKILRRDLESLAKEPPHKATDAIAKYEERHGVRRASVWAELGEAPLAQALEYLAIMAKITKSGLAAGKVEDLSAKYQSEGWLADDAVLRALAQVDRAEDLNAVQTAVRSIYLPWIEESARHLQKVWKSDGKTQFGKNPGCVSEECLLFVDGLRFDCAKRLSAKLQESGYEVEESAMWAALPSVTATGKPAVAPLSTDSNWIKDEPVNSDFEAMSTVQLCKAIKENGYSIVSKHLPCPPASSVDKKIWCEFGDIDHEGHDRGWKLARQIDELIREIQERIAELLTAGWKRIRVVTDHGWLLMPGGLPKNELPSFLVDSKWGRCAALTEGASTEERLFPWYWNPHQHFALADGISCYRKGEEYTHGGLSLQECLTLQLTVTRNKIEQSQAVEFTDVGWNGLRCTVAVAGEFAGTSLDVRRNAGDAASSVVVEVKALKKNGTASVVVENEDLEGLDATIVLLADNGSLLAQINTVIGGGNP